MSPQELEALIKRGERVTIIDARKAESYQRSDTGIPSALRIAPDQIADALGDIPQGAAIVVYCDCAAENSSVKVAENLMQRNFSNVFALRGGLNAWRDAGLPEVSRTSGEAHAPTP